MGLGCRGYHAKLPDQRRPQVSRFDSSQPRSAPRGFFHACLPWRSAGIARDVVTAGAKPASRKSSLAALEGTQSCVAARVLRYPFNNWKGHAMLRSPIKRLHRQKRPAPPQGDGSATVADGEAVSDVEVEVAPMTYALISIWHNRVQKLIDRNYRHWPAQAPLVAAAGDRQVRADVGWNWHRIYLLAALQNYAALGSGPALAWCLLISDVLSGRKFPVGMLTVVPQFRCDVNACVRERTFAWYLSDAPRELYAAMSMDLIKGVANALLDTAIQSGFEVKLDGTLLLRADPAGGPRLRAFYQEGCGMTSLPASHPPLSLWRRSRSDEYFTMHATAADVFCKKNDDMR